MPGFYEKKINEEALSVYGSVLWEELTDFVEGKVLLTGGSGSGFEVIARFQAYPGKSGKRETHHILLKNNQYGRRLRNW